MNIVAKINRLEVLAYLTFVKDLSIVEIIDLSQQENNIVAQIADAPDFWRAVIDKFYGPMLLERRRDIDEKDYKLFAYSLHREKEYPYYIGIDLNVVPGRKLSDLTTCSKSDFDAIAFKRIDVLFQGFPPTNGAQGFVAKYALKRKGRYVRDEFKSYCFLGSSETDLASVELSFKTFLAIKVYNDLVEGAVDNELIRLRTRPLFKLAAKDTLMANFVNYTIKESELLTNISVKTIDDDEEDRCSIDIWIARI